jgi:hypothetical protein
VVAKGYAVAADIATDLGITLTGTQEAQVAKWIEDAEAFLDATLSRAWLTGALTDEAYTPYGADVFLRQKPVTSVQNVKGRYRLNATATTLTLGTHYEVRDLTRGWLYVAPWAAYDWLTVSYTPVASVPRLVNRATRLLVEEGLASAVGGAGNIKSFSAFGQVSVTFRDESISPQVRSILDSLRVPVLV